MGGSRRAAVCTSVRNILENISYSSARFWQQMRFHLQTEISISHADIPVIATSLVSGLCDSSAYNAWSCFVSMQTGNTIFLVLGASGQPANHPYGWLKSLISILFFFTGCFCFAATRHVYPLTRGTLAGSFFLQGLCIIFAAALVQSGMVLERDDFASENDRNASFMELLPLSFLAFQSGGQIVTSRLLGFNEVPTTVLTSVYCDLASDPSLLAPFGKNTKRNRRLGTVVTFLIGGITGGLLSKSSAHMWSALYLGGSIKIAIAIAWSSWKGKSFIRV